MISRMSLCKVLLLIFLTFLCSKCEGTHMRGRFSRNIKNYELVYPVKLSTSGRVVSHNLKHFHSRYYESRSRRSHSSNNETVRYRIAVDYKDHNVSLHPNFNLVAPGSVVEYRRARSLEGLPNIKLRPLGHEYCHFHGHIDGEVGSRAVLSTCDGLAGYLMLRGKLYLIEPVHDRDYKKSHGGRRPHILYEYKSKEALRNLMSAEHPDQDSFCGTRGSGNELPKLGRALHNPHMHHKPHVKESKEYFLEIGVVADKTMIAYHKDMDLEQYILTVFNMAYNLYHDATLGANINLVLVQIIRLEDDETEMNNAVVTDAPQTLKSFCEWANKQNPAQDSHPNHHDVSILLTRVDLCDTGSECGLLGLAYTGGACTREAQCNICEDNGLALGFVLAHEIGHNLGMNHDTEEETGCPAELPDGSITVMSPYVSMDITEWSPCSKKSLIKFLDDEKGKCMEDKPKEHKFNIADILPGVVYGATYQCQQLFDPSSKECSQGFTCAALVCETPKSVCYTTDIVPAAGTPCGENKWCYKRECLTVGQRPGSVDGEWGSWSEWSECSRDCGLAMAYSTRACDNPPPAHGGRYCVGDRKKFKICDLEACPADRLSFREEQCAAFDDGDLTWKPYYWHTEHFCALICQNSNKEVGTKAATVKDGTRCMRGIRDVCIGGSCKTIPCDNDLQSNAVEDACGVCHGDGTSCTVERGDLSFKMKKGVLSNVIDVPVGATNIVVEETTATKAKIILKHNNTPITKGDPSGNFKIGDSGMTGWMGMLKNLQEVLYIKGPTTEPLTVSVHAGEDVTISYSMGVKATKKRKPQFHWDFAEWSTCSADCGVGSQVSQAQCMEKEAGLVESSHCKKLEKPDPQSRACESNPCTL